MLLKILGVLCILLLLLIVVLIIYIIYIKSQIKHAALILDDIAVGNFDRRIITHENNMTTELCYKINDIVIQTKKELIKQNLSERSYRQLVTSLSHDIRTPLASLVGYLDAVSNHIVEGEEKDAYINTALSKAYDLKDYIDTLFEWLKIESGERIFHFEKTDLYELTRNIITDWIPQLEKLNFSYEINIPDDAKLILELDNSAFQRILNNLIQNIIIHSNGNKFNLEVYSTEQSAEILVSDNGQGISEKDLPYIFDRLYKCNTSRGAKGNGLGLSIVKELVKAHNGQITVSSVLSSGTVFNLSLPRE